MANAPYLSIGNASSMVGKFQSALNSKEEETRLQEFFEVAPKDELTKLWTAVKGVLDGVVASSFATAAVTNDNQIDQQHHQKGEEVEEESAFSLGDVPAVVHAVSVFVKISVLRPVSLVQCIELLARLLDTMSSQSPSEGTLKNSISSLCEQWYIRSEPNCSQLLPQTVTYLLVESLKPMSKESLVKRLFSIRQGFQELDLSTAGSDFNKDLLLRCFLHPTFLKSSDGIKLLSFLLAVSEGVLLDSVIGVIKSQVSNGAKSISAIYGEILQRSWREIVSSADSTKHRVALENCLQELIHEAMHSSNPKYFRGIRFLIKSFHDIKRSDMFEEMLVKVFEPILWRSLRCANATVRSQTAVLFLDVFPLQRVNAKPEECDQLLQKQFDQLIALLKDGDHRVRATAVSGVFHILREYWDILPSGTVQNILKFIFDTLAFDVSSANVRYCVICGIQELLQQPLSHQSLQLLLPLIANSVHDKIERNRLAFVRLLNDVKTLRGIHFYDIVSIPHLLERLATDRDHKEISSALCQLFLDSFYPTSTDEKEKALAGKELVSRCIQFVEESPIAAEAFYSNLHNHVPIGSVTKLIVMLFHTLSASVSIPPVTTKQNGKRQRGRENNVNESDESNHLSEHVTCGLCRIIQLLLKSIQGSLRGESFCLELLFKYFTPTKYRSFFNHMLANFSNKPEVAMSAIVLTDILVDLAKCKEGHSFHTFYMAMDLSSWLKDVAYPILQSCSTLAQQFEVCRSTIQLMTTLNKLVACIDEIVLILQGIIDYVKQPKKNKLGNNQELIFASNGLAAMIENFSDSLSVSVDVELNEPFSNLLNITSMMVKEAAISPFSSDELQNCVSICAKAVATFTIFQECTFLMDRSTINYSEETRPLMLLAAHISDVVYGAFSSNADLKILSSVCGSAIVSITDAYYLVEPNDHDCITRQLVTILGAINDNMLISKKKRILWTSAESSLQFFAGLQRIASLLPTVLPNISFDLAQSLFQLMFSIVGGCLNDGTAGLSKTFILLLNSWVNELQRRDLKNISSPCLTIIQKWEAEDIGAAAITIFKQVAQAQKGLSFNNSEVSVD